MIFQGLANAAAGTTQLKHPIGTGRSDNLEPSSHPTLRWRKTRFELPVPPKTPGVRAVALSRSRRLSLAEKPLPDLLGSLRRVGIGAQPVSRSSGGIPRCESIPSRGRRFADVRRMHQAGWLVKHIS